MDKEKAEFGRRLKAAREDKALSQGALSRLCWGEDSSASRIGNYESGKRWASPKDLRLLAKHLNTTPSHLAFGEDPAAVALTLEATVKTMGLLDEYLSNSGLQLPPLRRTEAFYALYYMISVNPDTAGEDAAREAVKQVL